MTNDAASAPKAPQSAPGEATEQSEAEARAYIEFKESSNVADRINPASGSCGLFQSLPCSKLEADCPNWRTDRVCQEGWGERYMRQRFGSWKAAKDYWQCIGTCTNKLGTITKTATWW